MKVEKTFFIDAPPDKVMAVMRDPKRIEEDEKIRETLSVEVKDLKKSKNEHIYEVHTTTYARGLTGIDKKKTENNKTTNHWNLKNLTCDWEWKGGGEHANKAKVSGSNKLVKKGKGTEIAMLVDIEISIPLVGKTISKKVAGEFQTEWPKYIDRVAKWAKEKK